LLLDLSRRRAVDLFAEFIRPWCLASALALTGIDTAHTERLADLVTRLLDSDTAPDDLRLKARARGANSQLDCIFQTSTATSYKSIFLGTAQTVPTFLASAWAALLQHPTRAKELQKNPGLTPKATEELLRYAGPVHTIFRYATSDIEISGNKIGRGDRLILRLASANRDPLQFQAPDCLDFTRDVAGHVALSYGPRYCPGASLIRIMASIAIPALLSCFSEARLSSRIQWSCGTMLVWPASLPVTLGSAPPCREVGSANSA
jgi:cytochrome P450